MEPVKNGTGTGLTKQGELDDVFRDQIDREYAIDESEGGDSDEIIEIKNLYKDLALALADLVPPGRARFLAFDELRQSKAWAVEQVQTKPGIIEEPPPPDGGNGESENGEPETKPGTKRSSVSSTTSSKS